MWLYSTNGRIKSLCFVFTKSLNSFFFFPSFSFNIVNRITHSVLIYKLEEWLTNAQLANTINRSLSSKKLLKSCGSSRWFICFTFLIFSQILFSTWTQPFNLQLRGCFFFFFKVNHTQHLSKDQLLGIICAVIVCVICCVISRISYIKWYWLGNQNEWQFMC